MRFLRLLFVFFRVGILGELSYRANFFFHLFESILELGTALAGAGGGFLLHATFWAGGGPMRSWRSSASIFWWAERSAW